MFSCAKCEYATAGKSDLNRHLKRHANTPLTSNVLPKVACREPHIVNPHLMIIFLTKTLNVVLDSLQQMYPFKKNNHGVQTKISIKLMCKICIAFPTQKPSTNDQEPTFDTSTTPRLSLTPIVYAIGNILLRQTDIFKINLLSFCNTGRLDSSNIIMPATTTNY